MMTTDLFQTAQVNAGINPILGSIIAAELKNCSKQAFDETKSSLHASNDRWLSNWDDWTNANYGNWGDNWGQAASGEMRGNRKPLSSYIFV